MSQTYAIHSGAKPGPLTQDELKSVLHYDPDIGVFTFIASRRKGWAGKRAGWVTKNGYIQTVLSGKYYYIHRLAFLYMEGLMPYEVDHIDGNRANNAWSNIRAVGQGVNNKNQKIPVTNTSGVMGVYWKIKDKKWVAQIQHNKTLHYLGRFDNIEDAISARAHAEKRYDFHPNHGRLAK